MTLDATVKLIDKVLDNGIVRTALHIPLDDEAAHIQGGHISVDIIDQDGKFLCRLNIFKFESGDGDVDVIYDSSLYEGVLVHRRDGAVNLQYPIRLQPIQGLSGVAEVHLEKLE